MLRAPRLNPGLSEQERSALSRVYDYLGRPDKDELHQRGFSTDQGDEVALLASKGQIAAGVPQTVSAGRKLILSLLTKGMMTEITREDGPDYEDITTIHITPHGLAALRGRY